MKNARGQKSNRAGVVVSGVSRSMRNQRERKRSRLLYLALAAVLLFGAASGVIGRSAFAQDAELSIETTGAAANPLMGVDAGITSLETSASVDVTDTVEPVTETGNAGLTSGAGIRATDSIIFTDTIDLSKTIASTDPGYTVSGTTPAYSGGGAVASPNRILAFTNAANGKAYQLIQSGVRSPVTTPPKQGTSIFTEISIPNGVEVTLVISGIDLTGKILLSGTAQVTVLLDGANYIRTGNITVPSTAAITFDSYNGNDAGDSLTMPSTAGSVNAAASIGGAAGTATVAGGDAGSITIGGGTINITASSSGAGIGGGGAGAEGAGATAPGGSGGAITITGGFVTVTQYGSGNGNGTGLGGAGIGGGGGSGVNGGSGGVIKITGGTVSVTQYSRGAGIGGGTFGPAGSITISDGTVNIVARDYSTKDQGTCGIGTGAGTNGSGASNITITGGTINVTSDWTGIGRQGAPTSSDPNSPCNIKITGGTITSKAGKGMGVGYLYDAMGGALIIEGGTVVASSDVRSGIGGPGFGTGYTPVKLILNAEADVTAYSGASNTIYAAITASDNYGTGSYVNTRYYSGANTVPLSASMDMTLNVYAQGGSLLRTLTVPKNYYCFGYSTGSTASRIDNIYEYYAPTSTFMGSIVRNTGGSPEIYSIFNQNGYNSYNSNANNGVLPVTLLSQYGVTEKYVDVDGNTLSGDTMAVLPSGTSNYYKTIPPLADYTPVGYAVGSYVPPNYTPGDTASTTVKGQQTVYFVYKKLVTSLTVSQTIEGDYSDQTKIFDFTLYFTDSQGNPLAAGTSFDYVGGIVSGSGATAPPGGTFMLDSEGKTVFALETHQSITIPEIAGSIQVRVVEDDDSRYTTTFKDSADANPSSGADTDLRLLKGGARTFDFLNTRIKVPVTGIRTAATEVPFFLLASLLAAPMLLFATLKYRRRKRKAC